MFMIKVQIDAIHGSYEAEIFDVHESMIDAYRAQCRRITPKGGTLSFRVLSQA